jgi:hypothetical protein
MHRNPARSDAGFCSLRIFVQPLYSAITSSSSLWMLPLAARIIVRDYNLAAEGQPGHDTMHAPAPVWSKYPNALFFHRLRLYYNVCFTLRYTRHGRRKDGHTLVYLLSTESIIHSVI